MNSSKHVILCADDFGLSPGISTAILKLARQQRLSAVSCMTNRSDFEVYAPDLSVLKGQIHIGLHFNLTEGAFLSRPDLSGFSLNRLLIKTHCRLLSTSLIQDEFNAQLDRFEDVMGCLPSFIDGHQHVHQFPQIRQCILGIYQERLKTSGSFVRATYPSITTPQYQLKANILSLSGGRALRDHLRKLNIPHNRFFSGIYDFAVDCNYALLFRQWLKDVQSHTLIMCHPGEDSMAGDSIAHARIAEFNYFSSDAFLRDCEEFKINLTACPIS